MVWGTKFEGRGGLGPPPPHPPPSARLLFIGFQKWPSTKINFWAFKIHICLTICFTKHNTTSNYQQSNCNFCWSNNSCVNKPRSRDLPFKKGNFPSSTRSHIYLFCVLSAFSHFMALLEIKSSCSNTRYTVRANLDSLMVRFSFTRDCGSIPHQDSTVSNCFYTSENWKITPLLTY